MSVLGICKVLYSDSNIETVGFIIIRSFRKFKAADITVLCATANRITETEIEADGSVLKKVCFRFVRFRKY